mmetsp:Transcript_16680/g.29188  ORF Transcript_16680/g.29188 Transcript_16680/m.29188 type:complete len:137 (-) Transcript_16680:27-437(-)
MFIPWALQRRWLHRALPLRKALGEAWPRDESGSSKVDSARHGVATESGERRRKLISVCPFTVHRTASDNLPVYVLRRHKRTEDITVIKKLRGDQEALRKELEYLCRTRVTYSKSGYLQLVGNHRRVIKEYLRSVGY